MDSENYLYNHISFNHGGGVKWGIGHYSTSHIEGILSNLKNIIKKINYSIFGKGFYFHLKEAEFRYINRNKNREELFSLIKEIIKFN